MNHESLFPTFVVFYYEGKGGENFGTTLYTKNHNVLAQFLKYMLDSVGIDSSCQYE